MLLAASLGTPQQVKWSTRSDGADGPHNAIARAVVARRAAGEPLIDLTLSNPTQAGFAYPWELFAAPAHAARYQPESLGLTGTRNIIAAHMRALGVPADAQRMMLTASTSEAYAFLFKLLCDPGDQVLVPTPSYPLFEHLARLESVDTRTYPLLSADNFAIDVHALRERINGHTRAIVIVSPNNPTGSIVTTAELRQLATLGVPIISDEVFGEFPLQPSPDASRTALGTPDALVFSLFGLSKLVGLPQMKLAWTCVSGPDAQVETALARLELIADTYLSVSTPVQLSIERLLDRGEGVRAQISERTRQNLQTLRDVARSCPALSVLSPEAGWCVVVRLPTTHSEEQWVIDLIAAGVLVHPGHFYDFQHEAFLVLSLLPEPSAFREGIERLCGHVNTRA